MYKSFFIYFILFSFFACDRSTTQKEGANEINILPAPKEISVGSKQLLFSQKSKLYTSDTSLNALLELMALDLEKVTGILLQQTSSKNQEADLIFELDPSLELEEYKIEINKLVQVKGGSYAALASAKSTLIQIAEEEENHIKFPVVSIHNKPDASYIGLLIDLARQWHDLENVKKLIDLAAFYKVNYIQLHFTDYQSYTLPSRKYPNLSTLDRHYSFEELAELEAYSQARGVTIIPELEVPGHAAQFVKKYPEIFAIQDTSSNPWIINMGNEEVYEAIDILIGEMVGIFEATPYFHIGGDEAIFNKVMEDPKVKNYIQANGIAEDVHELYRHFIVRMNEIVKKHGKQMCVWEGFGRKGEIQIPKDLIVFEFETNRYLPPDLIEDGYTVVNTSWKPLYVVNQKKWEPKTIYKWNMWRWENWWDKAPSFEPIQVDKTPLIIGAQMCSWEQAQEVEIPSLRKRLPFFVERVWNTEEKIPYEEVLQRVDACDQRLSLVIGDNRQDTLLLDYNFARQ